jgi:hypothetical protein
LSSTSRHTHVSFHALYRCRSFVEIAEYILSTGAAGERILEEALREDETRRRKKEEKRAKEQANSAREKQERKQRRLQELDNGFAELWPSLVAKGWTKCRGGDSCSSSGDSWHYVRPNWRGGGNKKGKKKSKGGGNVDSKSTAKSAMVRGVDYFCSEEAVVSFAEDHSDEVYIILHSYSSILHSYTVLILYSYCTRCRCTSPRRRA